MKLITYKNKKGEIININLDLVAYINTYDAHIIEFYNDKQLAIRTWVLSSVEERDAVYALIMETHGSKIRLEVG